MAHDVFISYASSDKAVADAVCAQLESVHRIRCWIAPRDVTPGASWAQSIIEALDDSKVMVLIFSSRANASMQIEREVERAVHKGINIIPLRIEDTIPTKTLEYFISAPHWLDAISAPLERHIAKLAASIKALLARQTPIGGGVPIPDPAPAPAPVARPRPEARADAEPSARSRWLVPAAVLILVVMTVGAFAVRRRSALARSEAAAELSASGAPVADASTPTRAVQESAATVNAPEPAAAPGPTPADVRAIPGATPAPAAPITAVAGSAAGTSPRSSARGPARTPNLVLELNENLPDDGSIRVDVDGVERWAEPLTQATKGTSLVLAKGAHEITVTLVRDSGEVREARSTKLEADPAVVSTIRVRLSRFKRNLELETVVPSPAPGAAAPAAPVKDAVTGAGSKPPAPGR